MIMTDIKAAIFNLGGVYFDDGRKITTERISKKYSVNGMC